MIEILYEDSSVIVCVKPVGLNSQSDSAGGESMITLLQSQCSCETVYPVHRLDKAVGGVMAYAKTKPAAASLSAQVQDRRMEKEYFALVHGCPEEKEGVMEDILFKDSEKNKAYIVKRERRGVKKARLSYRVIHSESDTSLVEVKLYTGRFHQIRVQFASRKMPLVGDGKYGAKDNCPIGLFSCRVGFIHPETGEKISFFATPKDSPFDSYSDYLAQ